MLYTIILILFLGFVMPQDPVIPVERATSADWNTDSFWHYPWGRSVTHKGVDIFAEEGTNVLASTQGIVVYEGRMGRGGNVVLILGPKWRFHYYAHLSEIEVRKWERVGASQVIGKVGRTGNAANTPAHLHYSIMTPIPYLWRIDDDVHGWKKMFYLNPIVYFGS